MSTRFYSPTQGAAVLGVHVTTIYRKVESGELPAYRIGGVLRIAESDLMALLVPTRPSLAASAAPEPEPLRRPRVPRRG